jgi:hypothetical protein
LHYLVLQRSKRKMDVLLDIDEDLIKTFQTALVFLDVAFWNWLYGGDSVKVWD